MKMKRRDPIYLEEKSMKRIWRPALFGLMLSCMMLMTLALSPAKEVRAEEDTVESITYEPAITYITWFERDFSLQDNGEYHCNTFSVNRWEGDVLTVTSSSVSKRFIYQGYGEGYVAEDGESISADAVEINLEDYYYDWQPDGDKNYYGVSYKGVSCLVPMEVRSTPVASIDFYPVDRFLWYEGGYYWDYSGDEVVVNYKDGTSETFLYDQNAVYEYVTALGTEEWYGAFISQTDGHLVPRYYPDDYQAMNLWYDVSTRTFTIDYMGSSSSVNDNTYVLTDFSFEQAAPIVLKQGKDSETVTRDDGTSYEHYDLTPENNNLNAFFYDGDKLHYTFANIEQREQTIDFAFSQNTFIGEIGGRTNYIDDSIHVAFPDQSEEPLQPDTTYDFLVYMGDPGGDLYVESNKPYQVSIIGKPETTIENTRSEAPDFETWLEILADAGFTERYISYNDVTAEDVYRIVTAYYYHDKETGYTVTLDYEDFEQAADKVIYYYSWNVDLRDSDCYDAEKETVTLTVDPLDAGIHFEPTEFVYTGGGVMIVNRIDRSGNKQGMAVLSYNDNSYGEEYYFRSTAPYEDAEYEVKTSYYLPYQYDYKHTDGFPEVIYEGSWQFLEFSYYKNGERMTASPYSFDGWYTPWNFSFDPTGIADYDPYTSSGNMLRGTAPGKTKLTASFWFAYTKDMIVNGPENNPTYTTEAEIEVRPQTMKLDKDAMYLVVGESEVLGVSGLEEEHDSLMETSFNVGYRGESNVIAVDPTGKVTGIGPGVEYYLTVVSEKGQMQQISAYAFDIQLSENEFTADGTAKEPTVESVLGPYGPNSYGYTEYSSGNWSIVGYENNVKAGTATVIVELQSDGFGETITLRKSFTILPGATVPVTGISLDKTSLTLGMGLSETLKATVLPEDASDKSVIWSSSDESIVTVDENGKVTAGMNFGTATVTAETTDGGFKAACEVTVRFRDVMKTSDYYYNPVYWAAEKGITKGYTTGEYAGQFGVGLNCQRKDLLIFLWRFAGQPTKDKNGKAYGDARTMFNDMNDYKPSSAANKAVAWAVKEGITKGYADGGFHPTAPIVRKDVMILLYRLAGKPSVSGTLSFTDCKNLNKSSDTYKAILWGSKNKITNGYSSGEYAGQFGVNLNCLREQIVTFLYRYNNLK